jgi:DNA polymerase III subunit epsilon
VDFVAIDFETANSSRSSACAVGIAVVSDSRVVDRRSWLIRPKPCIFDPFNSAIHGIVESDVRREPEFDAVWNRAIPFIGNNLVVAHNAAFDMSVVRCDLDLYGISYPELPYLCSLKISRRAWPNISDHRLAPLARMLDIRFNHHNPEDDAYASAEIILKASELLNAESAVELAERCSVRVGRLFPGGYEPCSAISSCSKSRTQEANRPTELCGKTFAFTGTLAHYTRDEARLLIESAGGRVCSSVSQRTSFLIVGFEPGSKLDKAKDLGVKVIGEDEMEALIG